MHRAMAHAHWQEEPAPFCLVLVVFSLLLEGPVYIWSVAMSLLLEGPVYTWSWPSHWLDGV